VEDFLRRLFSDKAILPLPWPIRPLLARRIARTRAPVVTGHYRAIGGSPLDKETRSQTDVLSRELGDGYLVRHVFRYSQPFADDVLGELVSAGVERIVALPAYPQRSGATTGSGFSDLERAARRHAMQIQRAPTYPDGAGFIQALAEATGPLVNGDSHLILSAHGLPQSMADAGDPYPGEVRRTAEALLSALPGTGAHTLAFQSRVGKVEWMRPYLTDVVERLGREGTRAITVVPVSFVCENLETLYELDLELKELAGKSGISSFKRAPAPGVHPGFIHMLAEVVRTCASEAGWEDADG
jgi:ferrochelatase